MNIFDQDDIEILFQILLEASTSVADNQNENQ